MLYRAYEDWYGKLRFSEWEYECNCGLDMILSSLHERMLCVLSIEGFVDIINTGNLR